MTIKSSYYLLRRLCKDSSKIVPNFSKQFASKIIVNKKVSYGHQNLGHRLTHRELELDGAKVDFPDPL